MAKTVLIVDDSATLRASVQYVLTEAGYEVEEAADGEKGLEALRELYAHDNKVDVIITDINMPNMDGISFIREVKKGPWKYVPILVFTTESEHAKKLAGKAAGAAGWLVKPFKPEQLLWVVKKFVR